MTSTQTVKVFSRMLGELMDFEYGIYTRMCRNSGRWTPDPNDRAGIERDRMSFAKRYFADGQ